MKNNICEYCESEYAITLLCEGRLCDNIVLCCPECFHKMRSDKIDLLCKTCRNPIEQNVQPEKIIDACIQKLDNVLPKRCPECGAVNCGMECYAEDDTP